MLETGRKRGPKTDNPKTHKMGIKLDEKSKSILDAYCEAGLTLQSKPPLPQNRQMP